MPRTVLGVTFEADLLDASWQTVRTWPLPGIPSRTRFSPDGSLLATTAFVVGQTYSSSGFVTQTEVHRTADEGYSNLEEFALMVDGAQNTSVDRNIWGVTFENDECPSLSPDGSRIAYKKLLAGAGAGAASFWSIAVMDLASGEQTVLSGEGRSVDDQIEWLDDSTVLYGLPRDDAPGVTDVWSMDVAATATPAVFLTEAWSPSVVRP